MTNSNSARALAAFQQRWNAHAARRCLIDSCTGSVIRSHSVQNGLVLDALVEQGHVFTFRRTAAGVRFGQVGRNDATTFSGFCGRHDTDLFLPIDFKSPSDFRLSDTPQAACFAMRALAREYLLKLTELKVHEEIVTLVRGGRHEELQRLHNMTDDETAGVIASTRPVLSPVIQGQKLVLGRLEHSYRSLLTALHQEKFHQWRFYARPLASRPSVAASAAFYPEFDFRGAHLATRERTEDTAILVVNVMPLGETTWVMLAHHRRFTRRLAGMVQDFQLMPDQDLRELISKMLVIHCENTVLSPRFVEKLSEADKRQILTVFEGTMHWAVSYASVPRFDFFAGA